MSGGVDTDSRLIGPGGIFVAKPGEETDGHLFVDAAVAAGAAVAIVERPVAASVTQIVVPDAVAALADLARDVVARVRERGDLRIVGHHRLERQDDDEEPARPHPRARGRDRRRRKASFNNEVGAPLTMLRVTDDTRFLVSEFGASAPGEIARLAGLVEPDVGVVLMVGHGARRRIRRHRGDVRGEVRARARAPSRRSRRAQRRRRPRRVDGADRRRAGCRGPLVRARRRAPTCARTTSR